MHEKQAVYWRLTRQETEEDCVETKLTIADFILGPFDKECLSEEPPESDWSDWFPPPPRMTDGELNELSDWVEIEASKKDLFPNPDNYSLTDYFATKETYEKPNDPTKHPCAACAYSGAGRRI
jgi:hypothetical protein